MSVLKTYDLNPDGVHIVVNWDSMGINASVFILCINTVEATKQIKRIFFHVQRNHILNYSLQAA